MASVAAGGFVTFLVTAAAIQAVHLQGMAATPISAYLRGPHSGWLQAAYYVLSGSLVLLGVCLIQTREASRQLISGILLVVAGCAVTLVAYTYSPWPMPGDPSPEMRNAIHVKCAFIAFLAVTAVMFMETPLRWRGRDRFRMRIFAVLVLVVELASLPGPQYTPDVYGALEKLAIMGLVAWLIACALSFVNAHASPGEGCR